MVKYDEDLIKIIPSKRQLQIQQLEFYAFFHFTINTYTDREWGDGTEDPRIFNPIHFDARQWIQTIKKAGMKAAILTCKHHDGFCLWPSRYTNHSVAFSPYKEGKGDIVGEVAKACQEENIKFGVYLSPWDRNSLLYGTGEQYDDYFINQLTELLTQYGDIFCVWFDGACGEGKNGKKQDYDWERYYQLIRELQPNACINVCGPDIRWCGNEAGHTRESEWSVVPKRLCIAEKVQENSQQEDNEEFRQRKINNKDSDLGSRKALEKETELIWYPAEVDVSIRPGWFYHKEDDARVKSHQELLQIYFGSVGGNATLLLNIPPTPEGQLHHNDVKRLEELGDFLDKTFQNNLLEQASLSVDGHNMIHTIDNVREDSYETYYKQENNRNTAQILIELPKDEMISYVILKENITLSQRIEAFEIYAFNQQQWDCIYRGTVVGYKKIACLKPIRTNKLKINIIDSRVCPTLSFIGLY